MSQSSPSLVRNFTIAYVTALILIAGLIIGSTTMLAITTSEQIGDAEIINISGKQRMYSQRIAQFAQRRVQEGSSESSKALKQLANDMLADHEALLNGDPDKGIIFAAPPSARAFYFEDPHNLDARIRSYVAEAVALADEPNARGETALRYFLAIQTEAEFPLLESLEAMVLHYESLAANKTRTALRTEIFIAAILIVMLAAVGLIVFRPLAKRTEESMRQMINLAADVESKEKRLSSILGTLADGVITLNEEGSILSVNEAAAQIFGYDDVEIVGKNFRTLLPEAEKRGGMRFFVSESLRDKDDHDGDAGREMIGVKKNGAEFSLELSVSSLDLDGHQIYTSVVRDVTDRKKSETLLKRQGWVMENIADAVILADPQGKIIDCNARAVELTGYDRIELLGTPLMDLMVADSATTRGSTQSDARGVTDLGGVWRSEFEIQRKDGEIRVFENTTTGMFDDRDRLIGRISVNRDVTEQREIDKVKNEFISVVSHELRTPLTSIMGSLGLIKSGAVGEVPGDVTDMIDIAYSNSDRLVRLINDILDLEKIEAGKMDFDITPHDAMALLTQAVTENAGFGDKNNVDIEIASPIRNISVLGDNDKIAQVFANLLSNAIKFSPEGATVEIGAERRGRKIRFMVKDCGPGIPSEFKSSIFGKFSQADSSATRKKGGTGLGLSICKTIMERLGGTIGFDSEVGKGSTFYFDLPEAVSDIPEETVLTAGRTALVIEDDQDAATLLRIILEQLGLTVDVALDFERAQQLIAEKNFDAITLDIGLNGANGVDLLEDITKSDKNRGVPVVIVSGRKREDLPELEGGVIDLAGWIRKPVDIEALKEILRNCLAMSHDGKPRVLHVEDDGDVGEVVQKILEGDVEIVRAESLAAARTLLKRERKQFDLVLLDLALGDGRGEELLPDLKTESGACIPVVVFSANDLDQSADIAKVTDVLQKSRTSNEDLAACVMSAIQRHNRAQTPLNQKTGSVDD